MTGLPQIDHQAFERGQNDEANSRIAVKFTIRTVLDKNKTREKGEPVHMEREYIEKLIPGRRDPVVQPVNNLHIKQFPEAYRRFQERTGDVLEGTPLREWTGITRSLAEDMIHNNILTVESLANAADVQLAKFMGGRTLKEKAKNFIEEKNSDKPFREMKKDNDDLKAVVKDLLREVEDLKSQLEPKKKGK